MAAARALDVLLGAGTGRLRAAAPAALLVGAHTLGITGLSRGEVSGADRRVAGAALFGTAAIASTAAMAGGGGSRTSGAARPASLGLLGAYAVTVGRPQLEVIGQPSAVRVRRAVGAGILGLIPLQAGLTARAGAPAVALSIAAALPLAKRLSRKVSPT
jgi:4-hydroxybenzoate polyprenyltransferase